MTKQYLKLCNSLDFFFKTPLLNYKVSFVTLKPIFEHIQVFLTACPGEDMSGKFKTWWTRFLKEVRVEGLDGDGKWRNLSPEEQADLRELKYPGKIEEAR